MKITNFSSLTPEARQIWIDVFFHERQRHVKDIEQIDADLAAAKQMYGIEPRNIFVDRWIEVGK